MALYLGYTLLTRIHLARGELDAARSAFQKAEEALTKTYSPYRRDAYLIVHWVQFWLASGEVERAINWVQELAQHTSVHSPLAREREDVARARILLVQKRPTEALSLLEPLQVNAEKQERFLHDAFMTLPPYSRTSKDEAHHLSGGRQSCRGPWSEEMPSRSVLDAA